jgi:hypothetical protein
MCRLTGALRPFRLPKHFSSGKLPFFPGDQQTRDLAGIHPFPGLPERQGDISEIAKGFGEILCWHLKSVPT